MQWLSPLVERAELLGRLAGELREGLLLRPVLVRADSDEVWVGGPREPFVAWLRALDWWLRNPLAAGVAAVGEALRARVVVYEEAQRQLDQQMAGVTCPPPPALLGLAPGIAPAFGRDRRPVVGEVKMDPDQLEALGNTLGQARDVVLTFARRVRAATEPLPPLVPPPGAPPGSGVAGNDMPLDAPEAAGCPAAYERVAWELDAAMADVFERARHLRSAGGFGGGLLGLPGLEILRRPSELIVEALTPEGAAEWLRGVRDGGGSVPAAVREIRDRVGYGPPEAAAIVNQLGVEGIRDLYRRTGYRGGTSIDKEAVCAAGELVADASRSGALDPEILDWLREPGSGLLPACGEWDPALAYELSWAPTDTDRRHWSAADRIESGFRFLARHPDAAARYLAEHRDVLFHYVDRGFPGAGLVLAAALEATAAEQRRAAVDAAEKVMWRMAHGEEVGDDTKRAVAAALASSMDEVIAALEGAPQPAGTDKDEIHPSVDDVTFDLPPEQLEATIAQLATDAEAWGTLFLAATGEVTELAARWSDTLAGDLPDHPTEEELAAAIGTINFVDSPDAQAIGKLFGVMFRGAAQAGDEAAAAAARGAEIMTLVTSLGLTAATALVAGPAAGALGAAAGGAVVSGAKGVFESEFVDRRIDDWEATMSEGRVVDAEAFAQTLLPEINNLVAVELFNNPATRAKLLARYPEPLPECCGGPDGPLVIPRRVIPGDETGGCWEQWDDWVDPDPEDGKNLLWSAAHELGEDMTDAFVAETVGV